ncbi:MAG: UDPGP type 1 family protein [Fusicatenibacter sp.]|nr:UDPGP type 1 family protein [Fusicatenibacter sp.]
MKQETKQLLEQYGQTHLLSFYDQMKDHQKLDFERQLDTLDWSVFDCFDENSSQDGKGIISPIDALSIADIEANRDTYVRIGLEAVKAGKVGALLLAGGQGTRLGFGGPKGSFNIGVTKELYLFEQLLKNTMDVVKESGTWIPFFIMTSDKNHEETVGFLKEHNYFGYNPDYIFFFTQDMAPCMDYEKKLLMETKEQLAFSPNGNGGWFTSFANAGLLKKAKEMGVEWLNCFSVDNVLQRIADPCFVGAVISAGCVSGAKVVRKADPNERVGVLCLEDGKPSIIEYYEMTPEMTYSQNNRGEYLYCFGVILNYLFRIDQLEEIMEKRLSTHVVEKKIPYVDPDGTEHHPEKPNGYKFEKLILDMIHMLENCLAYEVDREKEFAPVKNKEGVDSIDTARELLRKNGIEF